MQYNEFQSFHRPEAHTGCQCRAAATVACHQLFRTYTARVVALLSLLWLCAGLTSASAQITYNFDNGTLQGWSVVSSDPGNTPDPESYASVSANNGVSPQGGTKFVMCTPAGNRDSAHKPLWIRSPEFFINQTGNLTLYLAGGAGSGGYPGTNATLPTNASQIPMGVNSTVSGVMGVALRDTATGDFVRTGQRSPPADASWSQIIWDVSTYRNNGRTYTIELFDYHSDNAWSFLCLDTVTIPGILQTYTLAYTAGPNGTISGTSPQTVTGGASGTAVTAVPYTGYHFVNWSDGSTANPRTDVNVAANINVTSNFVSDATTYILSYDANGGAGTAPGPFTQTYLTTIATAAANTFTRANYVFTSWNTAANGSGTSYAGGATFAFAATTILYAQWTPTYTLTYNANSGVGTAPGPYTQNSGTSIVLAAANTFTRTNFVFTGWNTAANGTGTAYAAGATFTFDTNRTLYAQWAHTIVASSGPYGFMSPSGTAIVAHGTSPVYTITPEFGYAIQSVLVDGINNSQAVTASSYTFTNVTQNHTISVAFVAVDFSITNISRINGGTAITLTWRSQPGATYSIEASDDLAPLSWATVATGIASQGATTSTTITIDGRPARFFRVLTPKPADGYVYSSFTGDGEDGLHLLTSSDGKTWKTVRNYASIYQQSTGLMRDPSICRGGDGKYHLVWTSGWWNDTIGIAHSDNLTDWTPSTLLHIWADYAGPGTEESNGVNWPADLSLSAPRNALVRNCWAPEIFYDNETAEYVIFWATTIDSASVFPLTWDANRWERMNQRVYYVTTKDFLTYTPRKFFYAKPDRVVIDACFTKMSSDQYRMAIKDELTQRIHLVHSTKPLATWAAMPSDFWGPMSDPAITGAGIQPDNTNAEGPTIVPSDNGWLLYCDYWTVAKNGLFFTTDFETLTRLNDQFAAPIWVRHGSVFRVPKVAYDRLNTLK